LLHGLSQTPESLDEAAAVAMALEHLGFDAVVRDAARGGEAAADAHTALGPTSMGWTREELFGADKSDEDSLVLSQSLELSGRAARRAAAARATGAAARHGAEARRNDHVAHLRSSFHEARLARERTEVYTAWRHRLSESESRIRQRVEAGAEAAWASQHSHHEVARGELMVAQAQAESDGVMAQLLSLLGWRDGLPAPALTASALPVMMQGGVDAYIAHLTAHPTSLMFEARARSGSLRRDAGARAWVPDLEVSVGYKTASGSESRGHGYTAGAQLSLPLGGERAAEEGIGRAQATVAQNQGRLWAHEQVAALKRAYIRTERLIAVANQANEHLIHGHEKLLASARLAYEGGELDLDGLLEVHADARDDYLQAIDLKGQTWRAMIELDHLTGRSP
jgi:outer membrane protein, heavy metal efflux system